MSSSTATPPPEDHPTSDPGNHRCFFYGTLMALPILSRVIYNTPNPEPWQTTNLTMTPAILPGYSRRKVRFADYPGITSNPEKSVFGMYVTGLTQGDLWRLDRFEGSQYEKKIVMVKLLKDKDGKKQDGKKGDLNVNWKDMEESGEMKMAVTYVFTVGENWLEREEWDWEEFVREKLGRWVGGTVEGEDFGDTPPPPATSEEKENGVKKEELKSAV